MGTGWATKDIGDLSQRIKRSTAGRNKIIECPFEMVPCAMTASDEGFLSKGRRDTKMDSGRFIDITSFVGTH